jgi:plastocyanin
VRAIGIAAVCATAVVLAGAYVFVLRDGLAADRSPGRLEALVAPRLVELSIPRALRARANPVAAEADAWTAGAQRFATRCAMCHGADGRGHTALASTMYPPVPDLASFDVQRLSDGALFAVIQHGVRWTGMPAFAHEAPDDIWRLVAFVRHTPSPAPQDLAASGQTTVVMDGTSFAPAALTVHVGETVTFVNKDPFPHNVASAAGGFRSRDLDPDRQWQFHAATAGTFPYECTLHPGMKGTLIVTPGNEEIR